MTRLTRYQLRLLLELASGPRIYSPGRPHFHRMSDPQRLVRLGLASNRPGSYTWRITKAGLDHVRRACEVTGGDRSEAAKPIVDWLRERHRSMRLEDDR